MEDYLEILKKEFSLKEGSFLSKLRPPREWDKEAFSRLVAAMYTCCERDAGAEFVERWIASGFWYLSWFVPKWTQHENFPRVYPQEYYEKADRRLELLAYWFFEGEKPSLPNADFDTL